VLRLCRLHRRAAPARIRAVKRALLGGDSGEETARNLAVEWRLDSAPSDVVVDRRFFGRLSLRGLAVAAAFELAILLGAVYASSSISATARGIRATLSRRESRTPNPTHTRAFTRRMTER